MVKFVAVAKRLELVVVHRITRLWVELDAMVVIGLINSHKIGDVQFHWLLLRVRRLLVA